MWLFATLYLGPLVCKQKLSCYILSQLCQPICREWNEGTFQNFFRGWNGYLAVNWWPSLFSLQCPGQVALQVCSKRSSFVTNLFQRNCKGDSDSRWEGQSHHLLEVLSSSPKNKASHGAWMLYMKYWLECCIWTWMLYMKNIQLNFFWFAAISAGMVEVQCRALSRNRSHLGYCGFWTKPYMDLQGVLHLSLEDVLAIITASGTQSGQVGSQITIDHVPFSWLFLF